jgi:glycosyltransferase involved in cell wall biosynthesis
MISSFGNQLALVGMTTDNTPVGVWTKKEINGCHFDFFSVRKTSKINKKPLIPERLKSFIALKRYRNIIFSKNINNVFIQTPEVLFAIQPEKISNICIRIPGVENPLTISRYWYSRYFSILFDILFFKYLNYSNIILATADMESIENFKKRSKSKLDFSKINQFPTRVDKNTFHIQSKLDCRHRLGISIDDFVICTTGRLSFLKGWKFMIDVFFEVQKFIPNSKFYFLGDGEDRIKVLKYIDSLSLSESVFLPGRLSHLEISYFLNASDSYIMGSYVEGWSTSLVEAIACGKPVVSTNFSRARELIVNNVNGFVVENHNLEIFVESVLKTRNLGQKTLENFSIKVQNKFDSSLLKNSILNVWKLK